MRPQVAEDDLAGPASCALTRMSIFPAARSARISVHLPGRFRAVEILHPHREVAQPLHEGAVVLQGEDRRGDQHGDLLAVHGGLERRADGHLGLAESTVAARAGPSAGPTPCPADGRRRRLLVGRVLPAERRLQLVLQIAVRREGEPLRSLVLGVERDELARDVLDGLLGGVQARRRRRRQSL